MVALQANVVLALNLKGCSFSPPFPFYLPSTRRSYNYSLSAFHLSVWFWNRGNQCQLASQFHPPPKNHLELKPSFRPGQQVAESLEKHFGTKTVLLSGEQSAVPSAQRRYLEEIGEGEWSSAVAQQFCPPPPKNFLERESLMALSGSGTE